MSLYILLAIVSYFIFALTGIGDKFLLSKTFKHPLAYAFYVGLFSSTAILLAPFGLEWIGWQTVCVAFLGGGSFTLALYFFYSAIQQSSASRVLPMEGGLVPVFTFLLAALIVGERLTDLELTSYVMLVAGSILISLEHTEGRWTLKALGNATIAAILFAVALTLFKYTYEHSNFISGFIFARIGFGLMALLFLIPQKTRELVLSKNNSTGQKGGSKVLFVANFLAGSLGGIIQNYAISLGSVTIVNAMQGVQFVFILILSLIFSVYYPQIFREEMSGKVWFQKIFAVLLISGGLVILSL